MLASASPKTCKSMGLANQFGLSRSYTAKAVLLLGQFECVVWQKIIRDWKKLIFWNVVSAANVIVECMFPPDDV
jgi:hypothetical protein